MDVLTSTDPTSSSSSDPFRPSFFELYAASQLRTLLKPAVRYVLVILAQRHPRHLLRIVNRFEEVYHLALLAVEHHYLSVWSSSFAENFYGLKRRRRPAAVGARTRDEARSKERLTRTDVRWCLVWLVGVPYVKAKLDEWWERNGGGVELDLEDGGVTLQDEHGPTSRRQRLSQLSTRLLTASYPYANTLVQIWTLWYNVRYLFDKTPYWRPWLRWMRIDIRRMGADDSPRQPLLPAHLPPLSHPLRLISTLAKLSPRLLLESLKYLLPLSIFFFKFLEWWYGTDNPTRRTQRDTAPRVPPPQLLRPHPKGVLGRAGKALKHNTCPLCDASPVRNPALMLTGYVFCYTCASEWLEENGVCPVTRMVVDRKAGLRKVLG